MVDAVSIKLVRLSYSGVARGGPRRARAPPLILSVPAQNFIRVQKII